MFRRVGRPLSEVCHGQARELAGLMYRVPGRRTAVSFSEIVERAVAAMHLVTIPPKNKSRR